VNRKLRTQKPARPAMSPLLRALTYSRATHEPVTQAMLLQCYTALDAFRRGYGSRELLTTLGRYLLVAEELCRLGHESDEIVYIAEAQAGVVQLDGTQKQDGGWLLDDADYTRIRVAFAILDEQLSAASLADIAKAETGMVEGLLGTGRKSAVVEAM
jgi:hypothetical protein